MGKIFVNTIWAIVLIKKVTGTCKDLLVFVLYPLTVVVIYICFVFVLEVLLRFY